MARSGLTNATLTLSLPVAEFISFPASLPGTAGSDRPDDEVLTGAMPSACLAVASVVVLRFSKLPAKGAWWADWGPWDCETCRNGWHW